MERLARYIACALDSENYTDPWFLIDDNKQEAFWRMDATMPSDYQIKENDIFSRNPARCIYEDREDEDYWIVTEIHEVPQSPYYLIHYHAYEGVDFEVKGFDTRKDAVEVMQREYSKEMSRNGDNPDEDLIRDNFTIYDDGQEWLVWIIVSEDDMERAYRKEN